MSDFNFDVILKELGEFGKYQKINYVLMCIPIALSAMYGLSYVFTASDLEYRCLIPECESNNITDTFSPDWISYAVPFKNDNPSKCFRFENSNFTCSNDNFDRTNKVRCNNFVYKTNEISIQRDWNLNCNENKWMLTLVGTVHNIGTFLCLPLTGILSDRFGRKFAFVFGIISRSFIGLARSFSINYPMFIAMELLDPLLGAGTYSSAFIIGMELVGPKARVLGGTLLSCSFATGEVILGFIAMHVHNWRTILQIVYTPSILFFAYIWLVPESVRWLITKDRQEEAAAIIVKVSKINNVKLSPATLEMMYKKNEKQNNAKSESLISVFKCKTLLIRLVNCSVCFVTCALIYYGLSLNAVTIAGNKYLNFILVCVIEIPGFLVVLLVSNRLGRRLTLSISYLLCAVACVASEYATDIPWLKLVLFMLGKFSITASFQLIYIYASELFPTNHRHTLLGICSMFGRVGSIVAPQTPLLAQYYASLPLFLMAGCALISGLLVLRFPETLNTKLPDTIKEAVIVGEKKK